MKKVRTIRAQGNLFYFNSRPCAPSTTGRRKIPSFSWYRSTTTQLQLATIFFLLNVTFRLITNHNWSLVEEVVAPLFWTMVTNTRTHTNNHTRVHTEHRCTHYVTLPVFFLSIFVAELDKGISDLCETFDNVPLTQQKDFRCVELEVFSFQ